MKSKLERFAPLILLVAILALWQLICSAFHVSEFIFPSPARIVEQTWEHRGTILGHAWRTFWVTMIGFGIAIVVGVLLGFLIGSSRMAYTAIYQMFHEFPLTVSDVPVNAGSARVARDDLKVHVRGTLDRVLAGELVPASLLEQSRQDMKDLETDSPGLVKQIRKQIAAPE